MLAARASSSIAAGSEPGGPGGRGVEVSVLVGTGVMGEMIRGLDVAARQCRGDWHLEIIGSWRAGNLRRRGRGFCSAGGDEQANQ